MIELSKKMLVKSMKYRIKFDKELYKVLDDITYYSSKIKNLATTMIYDWQQFSFSYNNRFGEYPKPKDILQTNVATDINRQIKENDEFSFINSTIRETSAKEAIDFFNRKDVKTDLLKGNRTLQTYRRDGSFPLRAQAIKNLEKIKTGLYKVDLSLLSIAGRKIYERKKGQFEVELISSRKNSSSPNIILDRIITGEYTMSDSKIAKNRKGQYTLILAYKFPKNEVIINEDKVMGIDLGVAVPATIAVSDDSWYREFVGSAQEIRDFERQTESRRKRLSRSRKWAGQGNSGRGYKKRTEAANKISDKIARFKDTKNHQWSKFIVDEAVKKGVGLIQLEDLSGVSSNANKENNLFLKRWTYYDLQQKIEYKAQEFGIEVVKVAPRYTSARCNKCGYIHINEDKMLWRPSQDKFKCVNCGHEDNADVNAARNLAIKDIDQIIKEQESIQKEFEKELTK